jgi:hypothetical protein
VCWEQSSKIVSNIVPLRHIFKMVIEDNVVISLGIHDFFA